jgi:hypothetical protein
MNKVEATVALIILIFLFPAIIGFGLEILGYPMKYAILACAIYGGLSVNYWIACARILFGK